MPSVPLAAYSTPDGSCLILLNQRLASGTLSLRAYHWSTFGSGDGTSLEFPGFTAESVIVTSFVKRSIIHVVGLEENLQCHSCILDITKKMTEFMFKEKDARPLAVGHQLGNSIHNSLIDCHAEVWTRFPVVAAIQRQTIRSSSRRRSKAISFVTDRDMDKYRPHFTDLIQSFEHRTRKPTGDKLKPEALSIAAVHKDDFSSLDIFDGSFGISCLKAGEWIVDIFCLIPLQIAVCGDNRFIPFKNGVSSAELERSLLGADVNTIVDSITLGW